jgi:hypothetical protein
MYKYLRYILYYAICIVCLIVALLLLWKFMQPIREPFASLTPAYLMLAATDATGAIYFSEVDVPLNPRWQLAAYKGISTAGGIVGSYGTLYMTKASSAPVMATMVAAAASPTSSTGTLTQISIDDDETVGGIDSTGYVYYGSFKDSATGSNKMSWVSFSGGKAYGVGTDRNLYFCAISNSVANTVAKLTWTKITGGANFGELWAKVSLSGNVVAALQTNGALYYALNSIEDSTTAWNAVAGKTFKTISMQGYRFIGVATDDNVYYTDDLTRASFRQIKTAVYACTNPGKTAFTTTGASPTFTQVEMFLPDPASRKKRYAEIIGTDLSCNSSETLIGSYCYQPCPNGQAASGIRCPYLARQINANVSCSGSVGADLINGACYGPCADANTVINTADTVSCVGNVIRKTTKNRNIQSTPSSNCPSGGVVLGRYLRIRPSMAMNNKICLTSVVVKNSDGVVLAATAATSTDGTCPGGPIGKGGSGCTTFQSGATYDTDADGGVANRSYKTYWDLDLGNIVGIKTVTVTGCTGMPILGLRLEVLRAANYSYTPAITTKKLGSGTGAPRSQTVTFRFAPDATEQNCVEPCPGTGSADRWGDETTTDTGEGTCLLSTTTVSQRSITVPRVVAPQMILPPSDMNSIQMSGQSVARNWVVDPTDSRYYLSCDGFTGSVLKPVTTTVTVSGNAAGSVSYTKDGASIANLAQGGYVCIIESSGITCPAKTYSHQSSSTNVQLVYLAAQNACIAPTGINRTINCTQAVAQYGTLLDADVNGNVYNRPEYTWGANWGGAHGDLVNYCAGHNDTIGTSTTDVFNEQLGAGNYSGLVGNPSVPAASIASPERIMGDIRCVDSTGGTIVGAFPYNNMCAKCAGVHDTLYITGASGNLFLSGEQTANALSPDQIPSAFADDYIPPSTAQLGQGTLTQTTDTSYNLGASWNYWLDLKDGLAKTTTYLQALFDGTNTTGVPVKLYSYNTDSFIRTLAKSAIVPSTNWPTGICVGQCDITNSTSDPLQLTNINNIYTLYGATCESPLEILIPVPSFPPEYVGAAGPPCDIGYDLSGSVCATQCNSNQIDLGPSCQQKAQGRPILNPTYTCPIVKGVPLRLDGSTCLYPCEQGTVAKGGYCIPATTIVKPKDSATFIADHCTPTSANLPGSAGTAAAVPITRWLCQPTEQLTGLQMASILASPPDPTLDPSNFALLAAGQNVAYVAATDIICIETIANTTTYSCMSVKEAQDASIDIYMNPPVSSVNDKILADTTNTCDHLRGLYVDLSNNLTLIMVSGSQAVQTSAQISSMQSILQNIVSKVCPSGTVSGECDILKPQLTSLQSTIGSGSTIFNQMSSPYDAGVISLAAFNTTLKKMGCVN